MFAGCCFGGRQTGETLSWPDMLAQRGREVHAAAAAMANAEKAVKRGPLGAVLGLS